MKLVKALAKFPETRIFCVEDSDDEDQTKWDVKPISARILPEAEGFFIVKGKNISQDGTIRDCYIDISLPERINDHAYVFDGKSLKIGYPYEFEGNIICAVAIDCFGDYELFYSKINPDVGIDILKEGLAISQQKHYIAEDLGYILRDEGRFKEAAEMFQIAVDETPSSYFIYGELATCYEKVGYAEKSEKYKALFAQENKARL
jgi:tetratricopeptide (TPR) repeat protein